MIAGERADVAGVGFQRGALDVALGGLAQRDRWQQGSGAIVKVWRAGSLDDYGVEPSDANGFKLDGPPGAQGPREGGPLGVSEALKLAHGFTTNMLADPVHVGLATEEPETSKGHGQTIKVVRVRITDAGRDALAAEA